jgi:hypothetical protein
MEEPPKPNTSTSLYNDREELELARELLYQYNLPIHRGSVKLFRAYIRSYGNAKRLKELLKNDIYEKEKLNEFVDTALNSLKNLGISPSCPQPGN